MYLSAPHSSAVGSHKPPVQGTDFDAAAWLQANCKAYWKMEEDAGTTRADSTGRGNGLTPTIDGSPDALDNVAGKVGQACVFDPSSAPQYLSRASTADVQLGGIAAVKATGVITLTANPNDGDTVTVNGTTFTFRILAIFDTDIGIGANFGVTTSHLQAQIAFVNPGVTTESIVGGVLTLAAASAGAAGNSIGLTESAANLTVTPFSGGADAADGDSWFFASWFKVDDPFVGNSLMAKGAEINILLNGEESLLQIGGFGVEVAQAYDTDFHLLQIYFNAVTNTIYTRIDNASAETTSTSDVPSSAGSADFSLGYNNGSVYAGVIDETLIAKFATPLSVMDFNDLCGYLWNVGNGRTLTFP